MRFAVLSVAVVLLGVGSAGALTVPPAGFEADSTQAVCALTGEHGAYTEKPADYTQTDYGVNSGDSGSSFEFDGKVWWLFGNTGATEHSPWGPRNAKRRWPGKTTPLNNPAALGSDSIATSPETTKPPAPGVPYNDKKMPPNQQCPVLTFVRQPGTGATAYANPSVYPDPMFNKPYYVSLRKGELPESGISEGNPAKMYVVFGTDSPANCASLAQHAGPCAEPKNTGTGTTCGKQPGSRTRSVMAVYIPHSAGRFTGLYDLSAPSARYGPDCPKSPDAAKFVNVQMQNGPDGYVYIWGTEGGARNDHSYVYLARILAADIASENSLEYWDGKSFGSRSQTSAVPLFKDRPAACMAQLGIQYNPYLGEWIMLYHCKETPAPANHPNGIYMRTAPKPWGPWSSPTTIFNPVPDQATESGYCYFIYSTQTFSTFNLNGYPKCPAGSPNATLADAKRHVGSTYGPYFVANWLRGTYGTATRRASTTIYYTLDTFDPYGQLIMRSTILGPAAPVVTKPPPPNCKGTTCQ